MSKHIIFADCIIFEDENLIFINKPAGISSLDERLDAGSQFSILRMAKQYFAEAQLCHRLDKETSGILVIAKNPESYRDMAMLFEKRAVTKCYHAVVKGVLNVNNQSIIIPLAIARGGLAKVDRKEGKAAETVVSTLKMYQHFTLLECKPITGRLHQIRIHLASQNFPIASDVSYGGEVPFLSKLKKGFKFNKWENEQGMIKRVALHAHSLAFELNEKPYHVVAPYPKDFDVFVKLLEKNDL
jgi:23S rRNA pseudouridine955/2504/2580 synthase